MDKSIMVTEADVDDLVEVLENLALNLRNIRISKLIIQYVDEMSLSTSHTPIP